MSDDYDWEAMASAIEQGRAPMPLPELLKRLYEMGVHHGQGWGNDHVEELGGWLARQAAPT